MTAPYVPAEPVGGLTRRQQRDLAGLVLVVLGVAGLVAVAFVVHPLFGAAMLSGALVFAGLALAYQRP